MNAYLLPGILGLLLGLVLHWTGLSRPQGLRSAIGLRRSHALRSALQTLGLLLALAALLMWLAVIDVDEIAVLPVTSGVLLGSALFGMAASWCGFTPLTAFTGLGGGPFAEAICTVAGGFLGALLLPVLQGIPALSRPLLSATLFRTTLDEPFLLGGGFLGQACAGALLMAIALCIPSNRRGPEAEMEAEESPEEPADEPADAIREEATAEDTAPEEPVDPETAELVEPDEIILAEEAGLLPGQAPQDAFIALLPGEEPLVVDTRLDAPEEDAPDDVHQKEPENDK